MSPDSFVTYLPDRSVDRPDQPRAVRGLLLEAKRTTYAGRGDEATVMPLLPGSKQLEYRDGDYLYRDIYFGMAYFVGQESSSIGNRRCGR
jgi:hypothetical protein